MHDQPSIQPKHVIAQAAEFPIASRVSTGVKRCSVPFWTKTPDPMSVHEASPSVDRPERVHRFFLAENG
jgi:hypothetical protein